MSKETDDEVGMIIISQNNWNKIRDKFPPSIKSIFPTMGFMQDIPIRISNLAADGEIIQIPKKMIDAFRDIKFHPPEFKVYFEPFWMRMLKMKI